MKIPTPPSKVKATKSILKSIGSVFANLAKPPQTPPKRYRLVERNNFLCTSLYSLSKRRFSE